MKQTDERIGKMVLRTFIDAPSWDLTIDTIERWAEHRQSRYVCICNVHSVVTAHRDIGLRSAINDADMATPDGMPVAWSLRAQGARGQERINGPDLMSLACARAARSEISIYLYGSTRETLSILQRRLSSAFPSLRIAGSYSPPFRPLTAAEDEEVCQRINDSGAGVVFVGLGCPKQEVWMARHRGRINAVMIGVGAAFDYLAGTVRRAPIWMQHAGLEWSYRLAMEPRRLWRRYLVTNSLFVCLAAAETLRRSARMTVRG